MPSLQRVAVSDTSHPLMLGTLAKLQFTAAGRGSVLLCSSLQEEAEARFPQELPIYTVTVRPDPDPDPDPNRPFLEPQKILFPPPKKLGASP